jgi:hypothetical protein
MPGTVSPAGRSARRLRVAADVQFEPAAEQNLHFVWVRLVAAR